MSRDHRPAQRQRRADDWRLQAACRPFDSDLFFPERAAYRKADITRAKAVCGECPVREACLQAAMDGREKIGIWGGLTPQERMKLQRRARRVRDNAAAIAATVEKRPAAETGNPTREEIRRGVAAGWLRIGTSKFYAPGETPRV